MPIGSLMSCRVAVRSPRGCRRVPPESGREDGGEVGCWDSGTQLRQDTGEVFVIDDTGAIVKTCGSMF